jgi:hypothetical protein
MQEALVLKVELLKSLRQQKFLTQEDLFNACKQKSLRVSLATIKRAGVIGFLCCACLIADCCNGRRQPVLKRIIFPGSAGFQPCTWRVSAEKFRRIYCA